MKKIFALTAAVAMSFAAGASAQTTTQAAVLGDTGNAEYPVRVQGGNGQIYACKAEIETVDGVRARRCVQGDDGAPLFAAGAGLAGGGAVAAGALLLVVLAANDGDTGTTTTTTPDS